MQDRASIRAGLAIAALALALLASPATGAEELVVIDPGHGGSNTGARGPWTRINEKRLTLKIASRTRQYLRLFAPSLRVELTRRSDRYLTLAERVRKANGLKASLFVSVHLNASESHSQKGFETFILSRDRSAQEASRLAQRGRHRSAVDSILSDLRQTAAHGVSAQLAKTIQKLLRRVRGPALDRGVRQAPFDVLMGLKMPGVLVEVGFIDHPHEGRQMVRPAVQESISIALAAAIAEHLQAARGSGLARRQRPGGRP